MFISCILKVMCLTPDLVDLGSSGLLPRFFLCTCHLCCRSRLWATKFPESCWRPDWKLFPSVHLQLAPVGIRGGPSCLGVNCHLSSAFYIWEGIFHHAYLPSALHWKFPGALQTGLNEILDLSWWYFHFLVAQIKCKDEIRSCLGTLT